MVMRAVDHRFQPHDLVGGGVALDFVNTVTARDTEPTDWLGSYATLLDWAELTGAFAKRDLAQLATLAHKDAGKAAAALAKARALREALCALFYAMIEKEQPGESDLAALDAARLAAAKAAKLGFRGGRLVQSFGAADSGLDLVTHVVAVRALEILQSVPLERLRVCDGHDCGWVFIDTSKNGKRRWCDMATCGNTAKARRHYDRQR
jgi:predicted RNA-binding Zn ribbon-like protein